MSSDTGSTRKKNKKRKISKHIADTQSTQQTKQTESPPKKRKNQKNSVKDPQEALNYLVLWKTHKDSWKFNKNTQTWLIRHVYDAGVVPKHSFETLLEYLQAGRSSMDRVVQEAKKRALCYQNKKSYDAQYDALDEHDQRKVYKRARKVLDVLGQTSNVDEKNAKRGDA